MIASSFSISDNSLLAIYKVSTKPTHMLTLYIARRELPLIEKELAIISKQNPNLKLLVAGSHSFEKISKKLKNLIVLKSPEDLLKLL